MRVLLDVRSFGLVGWLAGPWLAGWLVGWLGGWPAGGQAATQSYSVNSVWLRYKFEWWLLYEGDARIDSFLLGGGGWTTNRPLPTTMHNIIG